MTVGLKPLGAGPPHFRRNPVQKAVHPPAPEVRKARERIVIGFLVPVRPVRSVVAKTADVGWEMVHECHAVLPGRLHAGKQSGMRAIPSGMASTCL
ncbi:MAG: hypothetical protein EBT47_11240 [Chloroflexi bacterium]|nr:hypothetical protein [Chloroflexota bacterium]